jgi:hypothetical protein
VRRWALLHLGALFCALLTASLAQATFPSDRALERATAVAQRVWEAPCGDHVRVRMAPLPGPTVGRAEWNHERTRCRVTLDAQHRWSWRALCTAMVHEFGHLAGREHSPNPRSVMYPTLTRTFWRCR